jgi:hypothetical protein
MTTGEPDAWKAGMSGSEGGRPEKDQHTTLAPRWAAHPTKTGKDTFGWDQSQTRNFNGICRHTALAALAQLRCAAIRGALTGTIGLPGAASDNAPTSRTTHHDGPIHDADLQIPLGDAPVPDHGPTPCPPDITAITLSLAETSRLTRLATQHTTGLISRARLAFALRWSRRRRRHQAIARWHHYSTRLQTATGSG